MIETELWLSFASMLRSYAAAASLHAGEVHLRSTEDSVTISTRAAQIELHFDPESGIATWAKLAEHQAAVRGSFEFVPEGGIRMDGATKDLDHAAIDFVASVTAEGKGRR